MLILSAIWTLLAASASACVPTDLDEGVRQLVELRTTSDDLSTALKLAEELELGLDCSEMLIQRSTLTAFYQQAGTIAVGAGNQQQALHWLTEACRLDSEAAWDVRLGKQAGAVWEVARRTCEDFTMGRIRAVAPAWVDGRLLAKDDDATVRSGRHLVQTMDCTTGVITTGQIFVSGEQEETVGTPQELTCDAGPSPISEPRRSFRALRLGSGVLVGAGTVSLVSATLLAAHYGSDSYVNSNGDYSREQATLTGLTYGGAALVGIGVAGLAILPHRTMLIGIQGTF